MEPTAPEHEPLLLKVEEAKQLLNIGRTRVYSLINSGELKSVKVFGNRRIPRISIDQYIATLLEESEAA